MVFKSNYTLVICTTTRKYCADVSNASQEFCLSNTYLSTQSSSFKKGLNVVFEEHAIVQLQGKCLWLRNLYLNIDLPSLPLLNVGMFVTASFCEILLFWGAGAAACPQLCPHRCCQERALAHSASPGVPAPGIPHTPLLSLDAPALSGPAATPSSSPSQPARLTSALGLTRPEYRRIRFKTPVLPYTVLEPP